MKIKLDINLSDNLQIYKEDIIQEIREQFNKQVEKNFKYMIQNSIQELVLEESKNHKKQIKEHVEYWIKTMPSTELFFRDEFRKHLVDTAKTMQPLIDEFIRQHIKTSDCNRLYDALGSAVADKFYNFIRNENY